MTIKKHVLPILKKLKEHYPNPETELIHSNEMQLAVAVMLSAQTTDKKVNEITQPLFKKYKTWQDFSNANLEELTQDIRGVNFHKGKADRLIKAGNLVQNEFGGQLPRTMNELVKIPGVARKTANVIMQELWGITEGIVVDTHVTRLSDRLDLSHAKNAVKIEEELMDVVPRKYWQNISGSLVLHGRYVCTAKKPKCAECFLNEICPSAFMFEK
jgi:endonuclease-3